MLDFTSALYLGFMHGSRSLPPWRQLTTGRPAALGEPAVTAGVATRLADLIGCEAAILAPSTLHLSWDVFGTVVARGRAVFLDEGAYPIVRWGTERAAACGVPVHAFRHHDPAALRWAVRRQGRQPLVVCDGLCPACGGPAPMREYLEVARRFGGALLLDDTQALGILGKGPNRDAPYGYGGGGSVRYSGVTDPDVIVIASLAKGFGVPIAVLAGQADVIRRFSVESETRVHCSPPSIATLHATAHALAVNASRGDDLRRGLAERVRRFRSGFARAGLAAQGGWFPVQTLSGIRGDTARALHATLLRRGVRAVLHRERHSGRAQISFLLTVRHTRSEVDRAATAIAEEVRIAHAV